MLSPSCNRAAVSSMNTELSPVLPLPPFLSFGLSVAPGKGGSWGLDGAGALSLPLLAKRISRFFPNNIPALLDTSGRGRGGVLLYDSEADPWEISRKKEMRPNG